MIGEIPEELESAQFEICFDSTGALNLSKFNQKGSKEPDLTEQCDVCGDKATGRYLLHDHL